MIFNGGRNEGYKKGVTLLIVLTTLGIVVIAAGCIGGALPVESQKENISTPVDQDTAADPSANERFSMDRSAAISPRTEYIFETDAGKIYFKKSGRTAFIKTPDGKIYEGKAERIPDKERKEIDYLIEDILRKQEQIELAREQIELEKYRARLTKATEIAKTNESVKELIADTEEYVIDSGYTEGRLPDQIKVLSIKIGELSRGGRMYSVTVDLEKEKVVSIRELKLPELEPSMELMGERSDEVENIVRTDERVKEISNGKEYNVSGILSYNPYEDKITWIGRIEMRDETYNVIVDIENKSVISISPGYPKSTSS